MSQTNIIIIAVVVIGAVFLVGLGGVAYYVSFIPLYIRAKASGLQCTILRMIGMKLRRLDPKFVIDQMIILSKAGVDTTFDEIEAHLLAGGNLGGVVEAMVSAYKADLNVTFKRLCAIDLAGRNVVRAVNACVSPIVISVPPRGQKYITGVARDGIQLGVNVKVTVRADIDKLVGGANEQTIIARVGEGIVSTIGGVDFHKQILETPDLISENVLARGLDTGTSFEIVSVDVGDIEVLQNIGAKLQEDQADADQMIAQAKAEARRALAVAAIQENHAKIREMTALETLNKSEVPRDMAAALRRGDIWLSPNPAYSVIDRKLWDPVG